jgi:hypothetical protein
MVAVELSFGALLLFVVGGWAIVFIFGGKIHTPVSQ